MCNSSSHQCWHSPVSKLTCSGCAKALHIASEPTDSSCGPGASRLRRTKNVKNKLRHTGTNSSEQWHVPEIKNARICGATCTPRGGKMRSGTLFQVFALPSWSPSDKDNAEDGALWNQESRRGCSWGSMTCQSNHNKRRRQRRLVERFAAAAGTAGCKKENGLWWRNLVANVGSHIMERAGPSPERPAVVIASRARALPMSVLPQPRGRRRRPTSRSSPLGCAMRARVSRWLILLTSSSMLFHVVAFDERV